jgi:excisionase family DNA binding protein
MSNDNSPGYYTYAGAASYLDVSKNTIRNWVRDGVIPAVRFGDRAVRIRREDLIAAASPVVGGERSQWSKLLA